MRHLLMPLIFLGLVAPGCARRRVEARQLPAWVFHASRAERGGRRPPVRSAMLPRPRGGLHGKSEAADMVAAALQGSGLRFGTDGSVAALWGYLKASHVAVPPAAVALRRDDVVFFDFDAGDRPEIAGIAGPAPARCDPPEHVGIVSGVEQDGRIAFVEAREGHVLASFADPAQPRLRRDGSGRIRNSFLRPKRVGDPPGLPIFAGEMLCGVVRPRPAP
jgi:hypothetical protein